MKGRRFRWRATHVALRMAGTYEASFRPRRGVALGGERHVPFYEWSGRTRRRFVSFLAVF